MSDTSEGCGGCGACSECVERVEESPNERFERLADAFHRETGYLAPGKDMPAAMGGADNDEARWAAWDKWFSTRMAAAASEATQ